MSTLLHKGNVTSAHLKPEKLQMEKPVLKIHVLPINILILQDNVKIVMATKYQQKTWKVVRLVSVG